MPFGNSKTVFTLLIFIFLINGGNYAQQKVETADFLYHQLDYFKQNPSTSNLLRLSKLIDSKKTKLQTKSDQLAWVIVNTNIAFYHSKFGNIPTAIMYYEKAWKTFSEEQLKDYDIIENCLQPLGNTYIKIGDLKKAENTIKNYLYLAEQSKNIPKIISGITNLSIAHHNQGNYQQAINILKKGLQIDPNNVNILTNLATNYLGANTLEVAEEIANKVIRLDPDQINAYQILAAIFLERKDHETARDYMLIAKSRLLQNPSTSVRTLSKWQLAYIDLLLSKSAYVEVEKYLQEIYSLLLPKYSGENLPHDKHLIADRVLLKVLDIHAFIYESTEKPLEALKAYDLAFKVNAKLNLLYPLQETRIIQHSQHRNRVEAYISLSFWLYQNMKDQKFVEQAFQAAEHSKAPLVNEALISKKVLSLYQKDTLVAQKRRLSYELALYDTYILKEKQKNNQANISQIQKWVTDYDIKTIALKDITDSLQIKYPDLLPSPKDISISQLQERLTKDNTMLIEYFFGSRSVYQFIVSTDGLKMIQISNYESFKEGIRSYIGYFGSPSTIINDVSQYTANAYDTFNSLRIPESDKKLLIIPDGILYYLPFEALITQPTTLLNFKKMPFLLNTNEVSYEITASKYLRSEFVEHKSNNVLGIFPIFENTDLELPYSISESTFIQESFDGEFLEKEQATYAHFVSESKDHAIIHLATHAQSGSFHTPASIKFRNQDIPVNQLYGLQLSSHLIVLSACETGVGKLVKGEGPLSIARGFQYAGIENLLFSLWKVNDKSTSILMRYFYKHLENSGIKSSALHLAKTDYLNAQGVSNAQKSPYHWAAFVYYGEIQKSTDRNYVWYVIGLVCMCFIAILYYILLLKKK